MTAADAESRSLWSIGQVGKITAGLGPDADQSHPAGVTGDATTVREKERKRTGAAFALLAFAYTSLAQVASALEQGIKNGRGLMRETMPLQTIS